jgi:hypothetical protein
MYSAEVYISLARSILELTTRLLLVDLANRIFNATLKASDP